MCCFAKTGLSALWQPVQSSGTAVLSRLGPFAEPCGSWHVTHASRTGLCGYFASAAASAICLWQPEHSSLPPRTRLNLFAEPWASWQPVHFPSATGRWALFGEGGTTEWQFRQMAFGSAARKRPCRDACGL